MNRIKLKTYAPQARRDFIQAVTARAASYGLTATKVESIIAQGAVVLIGGKPFPCAMARKRKALEERITHQGCEQTMEAMAYTWFNRSAAIRFMELHGYLNHGYRVLSHPDPEKTTPEIFEHAEHVDLPGLNQTEVIDLKLDGARESELYRMLLIAQCNALHVAMPFLFERIDDETELLLPDNLLHSDSLIRKLVNGIDEEDWQEVEIIGWLYQFYVSEKKDQVIGKVVKSYDCVVANPPYMGGRGMMPALKSFAKDRFALLQMEPVSARITPITLKVAVYERDEAVTNVETVTFDSTSGNIDERKKWVSLVLRNRPYEKKTRYRLVLRDADTGIEQASVDVIIDRAFTDDF